MTEHKKITCDFCDRDLTTTGNCMDFRLALNVESIRPNAGFVTLMNLPPPMDRNKHFCGLNCLNGWSVRDVKIEDNTIGTCKESKNDNK